VAVHLLRTIPDMGKTLAPLILSEIHDISRFPRVGSFSSYARLVKCAHESAGKRKTGKNAKLYHQKLVSRYGKAKALSIIASVTRAYRIYHTEKEPPLDA
jgi:transposase